VGGLRRWLTERGGYSEQRRAACSSWARWGTGRDGLNEWSRWPTVESESTGEPVQSSRRLKGAESLSEASYQRGGRTQTTTWWCSGGSETARSVLQMVIHR
jgi:hypothetical protein